MRENDIIIWCAHTSGLISVRVDSRGSPVRYSSKLPADVLRPVDSGELFDILRRKDGTKVALPLSKVYEYLGWKI